jgi:hypothetical protein
VRHTLSLLLLAGLAVGCQDTEPPTVGQASPAIINGLADYLDPAVVQVNIPGALCTGSLISSKVVLLAAHCLSTDPNHPAGTNIPNSVFFGMDSSKGGAFIPVVNGVFNPAWSGLDVTHSSVNDSAIAVLATRYTEVTPIKLNSAPLDESFDGNTVKIVGFGEQSSPNGTVGQKMVTHVPVTGVDTCPDCYPNDIMTGVGICEGDSGGPMLYDFGQGEVEIAITSFGLRGCNLAGQENWSQRVDLVSSWISDMIATYDPPSCEKDFRCSTGCSAPDPDCPCAADGFCSTLCGDTDTDPDCPQGCGANATCISLPPDQGGCPAPDPDCGDPCGMEGHCIEDCPARDPDCPPAKEIGQTCVKDIDCDVNSGAVCLANKDGDTVCEQTCKSAADCAGGTCDPISQTVAICHAAPPKPGGCDVGTSSRAPAGVLLLALAGIALAARRRATIAKR